MALSIIEPARAMSFTCFSTMSMMAESLLLYTVGINLVQTSISNVSARNIDTKAKSGLPERAVILKERPFCRIFHFMLLCLQNAQEPRNALIDMSVEHTTMFVIWKITEQSG